MNDNQLLTQLAEANAYREETPLPETIWTRDLALSEIERRMGMEPRKSIKQPTNESAPPGTGQPTITSTPTGTEQRTPWWKGLRVALGVAAATAFAVLALVAIVLATDSNNSDVASDDPASVIAAYVAAYNAADFDALMALYTEESVFYTQNFGDRTGLEQIRNWMIDDVNAAAEVDPLEISNVAVSGSTVTYDQVWTRIDGASFCSLNPWSAVVENGKIVSHTFVFGGPCP